MKTLEKFYAFAVLCIAFLAAIGGTAYLFFDGHALFGVVNVLLSAMAFPYVRDEFKKLLD